MLTLKALTQTRWLLKHLVCRLRKCMIATLNSTLPSAFWDTELWSFLSLPFGYFCSAIWQRNITLSISLYLYFLFSDLVKKIVVYLQVPIFSSLSWLGMKKERVIKLPNPYIQLIICTMFNQASYLLSIHVTETTNDTWRRYIRLTVFLLHTFCWSRWLFLCMHGLWIGDRWRL